MNKKITIVGIVIVLIGILALYLFVFGINHKFDFFDMILYIVPLVGFIVAFIGGLRK